MTAERELDRLARKVFGADVSVECFRGPRDARTWCVFVRDEEEPRISITGYRGASSRNLAACLRALAECGWEQ